MELLNQMDGFDSLGQVGKEREISTQFDNISIWKISKSIWLKGYSIWQNYK